MMKLLILSAGVILCLTSAPKTDAAHFYRVVSESNTFTLGLTSDGFLQVTNDIIPAAYTVERSTSLSSDRWEPFSRGVFVNNINSVKVHEFAPPRDMVLIPGGTFQMGDALGDHDKNATPVHTVHLTPFLIKRFETSNAEFQSVMQWAYDENLIEVVDGFVRLRGGTNNLVGLEQYAAELTFEEGEFVLKPGKENHPAIYLTWYGAAAFCNFLSSMEQKETCYDLEAWTCDFSKNGYRLPTEAEWEFAARGGFEGKRWPWSDSELITHSRSNYRSSTNNLYDVSPTRDLHPDYVDQPIRTCPVDAFAPNAFGLYNMSGNVWEWVWDWAARYSSETATDPTGPDTGTFRIFRGGSYFTTAERNTCSVRFTSSLPSRLLFDTGFRYVLRSE